MKSVWYIIFNPVSGGGKNKNRIENIKKLLILHQLPFDFARTEFPHHEELLIKNAITNGYRKFICIGGDGTLHHMVNGVMNQNEIPSHKISIAVIPIGTGNDWVKNYNISSHPEKAIQTIIKNKVILQDIGKIMFIESQKQKYFMNAAGIGFDAFVVKNISSYAKWGSLAYILAALSSLNEYKPHHFILKTDTYKFNSYMFLISIGLCKYSGSGMQLTDYKNHENGFFDITYISNIKILQVIRHIFKLYFGGIKNIKESQCFREKTINTINNNSSYIQADGELLGKGDVTISLIPRAIQFIIS